MYSKLFYKYSICIINIEVKVKISLIICLGSLALYGIILLVYLLKIKKEKYNAAPRIIGRPKQNFYIIFALSLILILLPIAIPLETIAIAVVCACGVMGEYIALRDRLDEIKELSGKDHDGK